MKKYTMAFAFCLLQTGLVLAQTPKNDKDKLNQSQRMNDEINQSQTNDRSNQLETYDNFDGVKVVYYAAKTGTLDTMAQNPARKTGAENSGMDRNNMGNQNTDKNNELNRNEGANKNTDKNNTNKNTDRTNTNKNTDRSTNPTYDNNDMGKNNNMNRNQNNDVMNNSDNSGTANATGKCAKYVRSGKTQYDYIKMNLKGKMSDVSTFATYTGMPPKIKMKVYTTAPAGTLIEVQLGKKSSTVYPASTNSQYQAYTTKSGAWETVEFKYSQSPQGSETLSTDVDQITLLFNPGSSTADTFYFDDIMGPALVSDRSVSAD